MGEDAGEFLDPADALEQNEGLIACARQIAADGAPGPSPGPSRPELLDAISALSP